MQVFFVPCLVIMSVFWMSFALTYWLLRGQVIRLEQRMNHLERYGQGQIPEEYVPAPRPRAIAPSRYVTVDRPMRDKYYR